MMWGRLGPRFALEASFLILLAVGLGIADVDWKAVVLVMAGGWLLVSLIELVASRRPPWSAGATQMPPPPPPVAAPAPVLEETQEAPPPDEPRPRRWLGLRRADEGPVVDEADDDLPGFPVEPEPVEPLPEPPPEPEPVAVHEPEPLQPVEPEADDVEPDVPGEPPEAEGEPAALDAGEPKPRRRWLGLRRAKEPPAELDDTGELRIPEPPKHVRRLDADEAGVAPQDGAAEARAGVDREES